jgi:hypothetical protein
MPAAQGFSSISPNTGAVVSATKRILARMRCRVGDARVSSALTLLCQHFLKREAVFFNVLVYSECRAFRFPSAHSDKAISLHQEGNMAKKAKKAKKAKSAVKKTAKKTRKVAKKKK